MTIYDEMYRMLRDDYSQHHQPATRVRLPPEKWRAFVRECRNMAHPGAWASLRIPDHPKTLTIQMPWGPVLVESL